MSRNITIIISNASIILTTVILKPIFTIPNIIPNIYQSYPYYNPNPNPIWTPTFPSFWTLFKKHLHPANSFSSYHTRKTDLRSTSASTINFYIFNRLYSYHNHIRLDITSHSIQDTHTISSPQTHCPQAEQSTDSFVHNINIHKGLNAFLRARSSKTC